MGHEGHDHDEHGGHHTHRHSHAHPHAHSHGHHAPAAHVPSAAAQEHKSHAPAQVAVFVITCSDSRDARRDESGQLASNLVGAAGHTIVGTRVIPDDAGQLRSVIDEALAAGARAILITGGTGIGRRDVTIETVRPLFEKELPGFGELFRSLSYAQIGSPAMMSRAVAGTLRGAILFALPGSPNAVKLAIDALILPELGHAVRELTR